MQLGRQWGSSRDATRRALVNAIVKKRVRLAVLLVGVVILGLWLARNCGWKSECSPRQPDSAERLAATSEPAAGIDGNRGIPLLSRRWSTPEPMDRGEVDGSDALLYGRESEPNRRLPYSTVAITGA
jgi:hypothetical protein